MKKKDLFANADLAFAMLRWCDPLMEAEKFSNESISNVENLFENDQFKSFLDNVADKNTIPRVLQSLGYYIGLTFIQNYGGTWKFIREGFIVECNGKGAFPSVWTMKRFRNGAEDNVFLKYNVFIQMCTL